MTGPSIRGTETQVAFRQKPSSVHSFMSNTFFFPSGLTTTVS